MTHWTRPSVSRQCRAVTGLSKVLSAVAVILAALAAGSPLIAQPLAREPVARHAAYFELGGYGGLYSLNYDRLVSERRSLRIGVSEIATTNFDNVRTHLTTLPVGLNFLIDPEDLVRGSSPLFGGADRDIELGLGLILGLEGKAHVSEPQDRSAVVAVAGTVGFRYQRRAPGFMLRMGLVPLLPLLSPEETFFKGLSAGISAGYVF